MAKRSKPPAWGETAQNKPRETSPGELLMKQARPTRWALAGLMVFSLMAGMTGVMNYRQLQTLKPADATSVTTLNDTGRADATASMEAWLKTASTPMGDDARVVSWNGSESKTMTDGSGNATIQVRVHRFTLEGKGRWWDARLTCLENGTPVDSPTLTPISTQSGFKTSDGSTTWANVVGELRPQSALSTQLTKWGQALAGDDADLLRTLVSDPDPNAHYSPLALGGAKSVTVGKAAYLDRGDVDRNESTSTMAVARVTVTLNSDTTVGQGASLAFDVLVQAPDSGKPAILAWGAPGSGPDLTPQSNRS